MFSERAIAIKRLKLLAWYLRSVPRKFFNLDKWFNIDGGTWNPYSCHVKTLGCGTTGCAIGWAGHIPEFNEEGFTLTESMVDITPSYKGVTSWTAVQFFFNISFDQARHLFSSTQYEDKDVNNPHAVAARIETFVKQLED